MKVANLAVIAAAIGLAATGVGRSPANADGDAGKDDDQVAYIKAPIVGDGAFYVGKDERSRVKVDKNLRGKWLYGKWLHVGDIVWCDPGVEVTVKLLGPDKDFTAEASKPFKIPEVASVEPTQTPNESEASPKPLNRKSRTGGRTDAINNFNQTAKKPTFDPAPTKGELRPVFWPANGSAVDPATLELHWLKRENLRQLSIRIEDTAGNEIWEHSIEDVAKESLNTKALSELRRKLPSQKQDKPIGIVINVKVNAVESPQSCTLLSIDEQRTIEEELAASKSEEDPFLRFLERIYTFSKHKMLNEVASEYDQMLEHLDGARNSRPILIAALYANDATGNADRVAELKKLLARLPGVSSGTPAK
jgi:hypothetical protein